MDKDTIYSKLKEPLIRHQARTCINEEIKSIRKPKHEDQLSEFSAAVETVKKQIYN